MIAPLFAKELRILLRSPRALVMLMVLTGIMAASFLPNWGGPGGGLGFGGRAMFARRLFLTLTSCQILVLGVIAGLLTATAITSERERHTLEMLYASNFNFKSILLSKWYASIFFPCLLGFCVLPIYALVFLVGGVGLDEVLASLIVTLITVASYAMLGLGCSAHARNSTSAMLRLLLLLICLILMLPICSPLFMWILMSQGSFGNTQGIFLRFSFYYFLIGQSLITLYGWRRALKGIQRRDSLFQVPTFSAEDVLQTVLLEMKQGPASTLASLEIASPKAHELVTEVAGSRAALAFSKAIIHFRPYWRLTPDVRPLIEDHRNSVYMNELRLADRSARPALYVALFLLYLIFSTLFFTKPTGSGELKGVAARAAGFLMFVAPIVSAPLIAREFEQRTMELLFNTALSSWHIVWGKFLAALRLPLRMVVGLLLLPVSATLLIIAMLITSLGLFWSSPDFQRFTFAVSNTWLIVLVLPTLAVHTSLFCAIGLCCSAFFQRSAGATLAALGLCLVFQILDNQWLDFGSSWAKDYLAANAIGSEAIHLIFLIFVTAALLRLTTWRLNQLRRATLVT